MGTSGDLDGELDRTVGELLFGDAVATFASLDFCLLAGVHLQKAIELFYFAPVATEVVVLDLAASQIADNRISPVRQSYCQAGCLSAEQVHGLVHRTWQAQPLAGRLHRRGVADLGA